MFCTECGQTVPEDSPFCKSCGSPAPLASGAAAAATAGSGSAAPAATGSGPAATPPPPVFTPPPPAPNFAQAPPPPVMTGGYGAGWQPPQPPPPAGHGRGPLIAGVVTAVIILLAALAVGLYFGLRDDGTETATGTSSETTVRPTSTASTSTTEPPFKQEEGEILLEAVGSAGPDSFAGETFVPAGPPPSLNLPTTTLAPTTTLPPGPGTTLPVTTLAPGLVPVSSVTGDTPALYGGSKDKSLVDKEGQLEFFEQNPDKAAAFCEALNNDPTFKWSGGTRIEPSQLRTYFEELTPMMLTRDTRVTNHGFRNGHPTPRQSVLQKGQMVLVDLYGVPRVRCECGNPLAPAKPVQKTPVYTGPKWPDFDPTTIIVVQPTTVVINIFVVVDINTGDPFDRPAGTEGTEDVPHQVTVWQLDVTMAMDDESGHHYTASWTGVVTLAPDDGSLSGEGAGQWHVEGPYYEGEVVIGSMSGDGSFSVEISGQLDPSASGEMLTIFPAMTLFSIDDQAWNGPTPEEAQTDFEGVIEEIIVASFNDSLQFAPTQDGPVSVVVTVEGWSGNATLAPYEE